MRYRLFIDAGHGGSDPGAVGNGMRESEIVLDVALRLGALLAVDFEIRQSRTDDSALTINERWQAANAWGADCLISIHANAGGGTGVETLIPTASPNNQNRDLQENRRFAEIISNTLAGSLGMRVRRANGVMLETETRHGSLGVLRHSRMIAIMPELAFIDSPLSNPDVEILRTRRQEMAAALSAGVYKYFGIERGRNDAAADRGGVTLDQTVSIRYRGKLYTIQAANVNDRFITSFSELSKVFGDSEIPVRAVLELAGFTVGWEPETNTIPVGR